MSVCVLCVYMYAERINVCSVCHCVLVMIQIKFLSYFCGKLLEFLVTEALNFVV